MALPTTDQDLANMALAKIAHTVQIATLATDSTTEARNARLFLDSVREIALGAFDWRWARKRAVLVEVTGTGDWWNSVDDDWEYAYTLPTDCVQPRYLYPGTRNPTDAEREPFDRVRNAADDGWVLVCDVKPVTSGDKAPVLFYTKRATTVTEYPQPFVEFFTSLLAVHLAPPVLGAEKGVQMAKVKQAEAALYFADAVRFDSQARGADQAPPSPSLAARGVTWTPGGNL